VTIRGIDTGATRDWGGSTRGGGTPNGSIQGFAVQGHEHAYYDLGAGAIIMLSTSGAHGRGSIISNAGTGAIGAALSDGLTYESKINPAIQLASETRMVNMACYIGIRY
jgi:hypothetical protein